MTRYRLLVLAGLLLGVWLRFHLLGADRRFHPDEALFVTFARAAAVQGEWLLPGNLDKPPLTIYANALALTLLGITTLPDGVLTLDVHAGEFAARIPGVFASLLLLAAMTTMTRRLTGSRLAALFALLLTALSPLLVAFSATAFTDNLMLLCLALALWAALRRSWVWSGVWLALGIGCKPQAALFLPLVIGLAVVTRHRSGHGSAVSLRRLESTQRSLRRGGSRTAPTTSWLFRGHPSMQLALPLLIGLGLLLLWDGARGQATSLWTLAAVNNEPGGLASLDQWLPRLAGWWGYAQYTFGPPVLTGLLGVVVVWAGLRGGRQLKWLLLYCLLYGLAHGLIAINIYDRYLLPLLPPLILLAAAGLARVRGGRWLLIGTLLLLPTAFDAARDQLPLGSAEGMHPGMDRLGAYLEAKPLGTVIYDRWLGWELGYYLGTWSNKRLTYYPTPEALIPDALALDDPAPRYFVAPDDVDVTPWLEALRRAGFTVRLDYDQPPLRAYQLLPPR